MIIRIAVFMDAAKQVNVITDLARMLLILKCKNRKYKNRYKTEKYWAIAKR